MRRSIGFMGREWGSGGEGRGVMLLVLLLSGVEWEVGRMKGEGDEKLARLIASFALACLTCYYDKSNDACRWGLTVFVVYLPL